MVKITKESIVSGTINTMEFNMEKEEFYSRYNAWKNGMVIQNAFPMLSADEREFLMTGMTPSEFNKYIGNTDDIYAKEEWIDEQ